MKKPNPVFILFSSLCFFCACNGNKSANESSSAVSDTMNNTAATKMIDQNTMDFVADAATGGMMEVELGNIAQQKATNPQVKYFGKMMVDDHTKINDNLKNIASKNNIDLPASISGNQRKEIDKLNKKSGAEFDKAYINLMVQDHKKNIDEFKIAMDKVSYPDIKNFITNTLPILQKHLDAFLSLK
jgi:putative membrane protein